MGLPLWKNVIFENLKIRKQKKKTIAIFVQKNGLTSLEKYDFWDFHTVSFNTQKRFLFYLQSQ